MTRAEDCIIAHQCMPVRGWVVVAGNYLPPTVSSYQSPAISVHTNTIH